MKIGVFGTGGIAQKVTKTLQQMPQVECYAIASRTIERAKQAAEEMGYQKAYGSYEELAANTDVSAAAWTRRAALSFGTTMMRVMPAETFARQSGMTSNAHTIQTTTSSTL